MQVLARVLLRLISIAAAVWLGLCTWIWFAQRSMVFFPQQVSESKAQALAQRLGAVALRGPAGQLLAWQFFASEQRCDSHWLLAHGNAGMALQREYIAQHLHEQLGEGACLTIIEYPGYGAATGLPSRDSLLEQAAATWSVLTRDSQLPVFLIGESLGTGVVAELAARFPTQVAGILLLTPYDDLAAVAGSHFPWLPTRWLLRDRFVPVQQLAEYSGPVQLIVAGADRVIPPIHAERLAAALRNAKVHMHVEEGLDHNDLERRPQWWELLKDLRARAASRVASD